MTIARIAVAACAALGCGGMAAAQDAAGSGLTIQLNSAQTLEDTPACRLTFVMENASDTDLAQVGFSAGVFDTSGRAELIAFSFGQIAADSLRLRRFDLAETTCAEIDMILLQDASCVDGAGADVSGALCGSELSLTRHPDVTINLR